jgi:hypothetical protein
MAKWLAVHIAILSVTLAVCRPSPCVGQVMFADEARRLGPEQAASYVPPSEGLIDVGPETIWTMDDGGSACCTDGCFECEPGRLFVDSWLAQGVTLNTKSPENRFNTPVTFNDRSNDYQMNQLYLSMGWPVIKDCWSWDIGAQVDLLYGTDYFFTTALGLETETDGTQRWNSDDGPRGAALYGLAMPQLFADVYVPLATGITVRMGHFYTTMGYESVPAPWNFFYSHSYAFQYGEPRTHTGFSADFPLGPRLSMNAGLTRGWDTWEDPNGMNGFLGGLNFCSWDQRTSLAFALHAGREDPDGQDDRTTYTLVLTHHITPCFTYVLQHDFGTESGAEISQDFGTSSAKWYGINQYLYLALSRETSLGLRVEWFRDQDNARVLGIPIESQVRGGNYTAITFGANWQPYGFLTVRPELRWDWSDVEAPQLGLDGMFNDFQDGDQFLLAFDMILTL